ncbi:hypothetical protein [Amycolatopsis sp. WAC 01416]|uniref:hypothetical protein n=1 Tax=Amycolatopsis sp. WAC 01416 TaxID=2203196 RepID=UPI0013159552|nr:hypothetical protein [Amycolatopsis sp. WAC 01416]
MPDQRAMAADLFTAAARGEAEEIVHEVPLLWREVLDHKKLEVGEVLGKIALTPSGS